MSKAIYPGSFDPVTLGHIDVITRASKIFDEIIVGVLINSSKTPLFSIDERVNMLKEVCGGLENVRIISFDGFSVDFAKEQNANVIIRGLRAITDFEYELQMAQTNRILNPQIDTLFLTTSIDYSYLSSSIVKEVAFLGGDISRFVPETIIKKVYDRYKTCGKDIKDE